MTNDGDPKATGRDAIFNLESEVTGTFIGANNSDLDTIIRGTMRGNNIILDSQYLWVSLPIYVKDNSAHFFLTPLLGSTFTNTKSLTLPHQQLL